MKYYNIKNLFTIVFYLLLILTFSTCQEDDSEDFDSLDILEKIRSLKGVSVTETQPKNAYSRAFIIDITQPVDHNNPDGATFTQRVYLNHVDELMPMVFAPNGYRSTTNSTQEIEALLQTNSLHVTHRYFYDSRPNPLDWQYLTIKQSADDHHAIVSLFKNIYKGKWISSGGSKSGLTCLFHRRYYPDDVDATIAYVAPFTFGVKDLRYPEYLSNIGSEECFAKLQALQIYVLKHKPEILNLISNTQQNDSYTYSMDRDLLLELNIMDYPFAFWQYFDFSCESIPDTATSNAGAIYAHYTSIVPINSFSDENLAYYEPYAYQAVTELGAPAYQTDYLRPYLTEVDPDATGNPNYELVAPSGISYSFTSSTMPEIYSWLQNEGDKIIYIYGKNDPWSAGAIELTGTADAIFVMQDGANHRVKIADLDNSEIVYNALENWLGIDFSSTKNGKKSTDVDEQKHFRLDL